MSAKAGQWQSRTIDHPGVSVHQDTTNQAVLLMFDLPPGAPGAALGSVFVRLTEREAAALQSQLLALRPRP